MDLVTTSHLVSMEVNKVLKKITRKWCRKEAPDFFIGGKYLGSFAEFESQVMNGLFTDRLERFGIEH